MSVANKAALVLVAAGVCGNAFGQSCEGQWLPGYGVAGVNGSVNAMTLWDPDGAGPQPEVLVIGGSFSMVSTTSVRNLAMWDGEQWTSVGGGVSGAVKALAVYQGKLVVGGSFSTAGSVSTGRLAFWDGTTWTGAGPEPTAINALEVYQGELIVAGTISFSGSSTSVAKWNGATWSFLGANSSIGSAVNALTTYDGKLIAAGTFTTAGGNPAGGIAAWNGAWNALGTGIAPGKAIRTLKAYDGKLFAGGNFTAIGGASALYLGKWNGTQWESAGLPVSSGGLTPGVNSMTLFGGKLVVGGDTSVRRINTWDGAAWGELGQWTEAAVLCLQSFNGSLFAGTEGSYRTVLGRGLIEYRDDAWNAIGIGFDDSLSSLAEFDGKLMLGGQFDQITGTDIRGFGQWSGTSWSPVGSNAPYAVQEMRTVNGVLYASGPFNGLSGWNGSVWSAIPGMSNSFGSYPTLSEFQGELITVGRFSLAGASMAVPVAAWTGTQWRTFGTGLTGQAFSAVEYQGDLVVSESLNLRLSSDPAARGIFRYDGSAWHAWPVSLSYAGTLAVHNGKLIVASNNVRGVDGTNYGPIAQWEGDHWESVGGGVSGVGLTNVGVRILKTYQGDLIAAGVFNLAGGVPVNNIARWNGVQWQAMGSGITGSIVDIQQYRDELVVIGLFGQVDGLPSACFARWTDDPKPWIAVSPQSMPVNEGLSLKLNAAAASRYENVTYKWQRNGVDVVEGAGGASAGGGFVNGASGALASPSTGSSVLLTVSGVQASDAGAYTIVFSNGCNDATSAAAAVSVNTCPGDLNADGVIDDADFTIFVGAYNVLVCEDPSMPVGCPADLNGDGLVDDLDFQGFVVGYNQLVCE